MGWVPEDGGAIRTGGVPLERHTAFERRSAQRSTRSNGLDQIRITGPADAVSVIWAAVDVVASQIIDDAVAGTERNRTSVVSERGGLGAIRFDAHTVRSNWHNDRLDFGFVVSVITENCLHVRRHRVPAGTSTRSSGSGG